MCRKNSTLLINFVDNLTFSYFLFFGIFLFLLFIKFCRILSTFPQIFPLFYPPYFPVCPPHIKSCTFLIFKRFDHFLFPFSTFTHKLTTNTTIYIF